MNARWLTLSAAVVAVAFAVLFHGRVERRQLALAAERTRAAAEAATMRTQADEAARQLVAARSQLEALLAERANRAAPPPAPTSKPAAIRPDPALRQMQVQAFVSEQGLRFAALFKRVGFGSEQRERFERIQAGFQQAMLDETQTAAGRQEARWVQDERLKELFGPAHEQWTEASRSQPARAVVEEIVQKMFPGSGALTGGQADELTRIVSRHRLPPGNPGKTSYAWDEVVTEARAILDERQLESFSAAVEFRRTSEKMSALSAGRGK